MQSYENNTLVFLIHLNSPKNWKKEPIQFIGNKHPTKKARHFFLRPLESNFNFAYSTIKIILLAVCISRATYITSQIFELYFKRKLFIWPTVKSELFWTPLIMASDQRAEVINSQGDVSQTEISVTFIDLI